MFLAAFHYRFTWKMALVVKLQYESWSSFIEKEPLDLRLICSLTLRRLMSYIYGAPILDVSRSHTTTQHSQ